MRRLAPVLAWLFLAVLATAQPNVPGQTYFGRNNYIEYRAGDLPLILSASHGGHLTPSEIPDRTWGSFAVDTNTRELAIAVFDEIFARTGRRPHLVISHLRRIKLDPNREIIEAAQGNPVAEQAWREYHGFISSARAAARSAHGFAHLVDIHGHGHAIARLELGYALGNAELNLSDAALNHPGYAWMSTLRTLALSRPGVPFPELLRGHRSLGDLLTRRGVEAWPSPQFPSPGDNPFWNGGYIVRTHSCLHDNDVIHGVQIETHWSGVRDSESSRAAFATRFAHALQPYLWDNYGYDLGTLSVTRIEPPATLTLARGGPPLTLTLRRSGWLGLSTSMAFTLGGSAVRGSGGDYSSSLSVNVFFSAGQTTTSITLSPAATGPAFGDKTLTLTLAPSATQTADTTPLVLTLHDGLSQTVRASALTPSVFESAPAARFRLTRTHGASPLTVPLVWSGSALPGADYHSAPASVTFAAGQSSLDLDIPLVDDGRPAPDRSLTLALGPGPAHFVGHPASATIRIRDDDRPAGLAVWLRGDLEGNLALDSSGLDLHATTLPANGPAASGPAAITVPTPAGGAPALAFDGIDDTLALPKLPLDPDGAFTLAFFLRLDAGGEIADQNIATYGTRSAPGSLHLYLATTNPANGTVALRSNLGGLAANALDVTRSSPATWQNGAWLHYALAVSADGTARVFTDGVLRRSATGRSETLSPDELLWFGWRPAAGGGSGFLRGALRDVRVYQRALSPAEIAALASARSTFASWLGTHGLPPSLAASADPDGDGLSLLLEYALAGTPRAPAAAPPRYALGLADGRLTLSFLRATEAGDLTWTIEGADSPAGPWHALARRASADPAWTPLVGGVAVAELHGHVTVTDATPLSLSPRRFLRVRVSQ